jgi:Leucine-rich repeat (LRR) protein
MQKVQLLKASTLMAITLLITRLEPCHPLFLTQSVVANWGYSERNTTFDLSVHFIQGIEAHTFNASPRVEHLYLDHNQINAVEEAVFGELTTLVTLNLDTNRIALIEPHSFDNMARLKKLILSNNIISFLDEDVFQGLTKLEILDLSTNQIYSLSPVSVLENLRELYFNENYVSFMLKSTFENLKQLETLEIAKNVINFVDLFPLQYLSKSLVTLDLSYNHIEKLPDLLFADFELIETILLSQNRIWSIGRGAFGGNNSKQNSLPADLINIEGAKLRSGVALARLRHLDLSYNKLSALTSGQFSHLPELETLVLANNAIEVVERRAFFHLGSLRELSLASNRLVSVDLNNFACLASLEKLDLCKNRKLKFVNETVCDSLAMMKAIWIREQLLDRCNCSELCPVLAVTVASRTTQKLSMCFLFVKA